MAERRMMAKSVIETDEFIDLPATSKVLYFYLMLNADDDGFVANPKSIMRQIGASNDDMKILAAKQYVFAFDSGVVVIKHWKIHNYIQKDRYKPTVYIDEKNQVKLNPKSRVYEMDTACIQSGYVGKDRIGKDRLGKSSSSTTTDDDLAEIVKFYEDNISTVSSFLVERLASLKDDYSAKWVMQSMKKAIECGRSKSNIRYIEGILKGWKNDGSSKPWEQEPAGKDEHEDRGHVWTEEELVKYYAERGIDYYKAVKE